MNPIETSLPAEQLDPAAFPAVVSSLEAPMSVDARGPALGILTSLAVVVDQPTFKRGQFLWGSSIGTLGAIGQSAMIVFLIFFLLIGGDTSKRKLVRLTEPSLSKRKITVHILDDINGSIQRIGSTNHLLVKWSEYHATAQRRGSSY